MSKERRGGGAGKIFLGMFLGFLLTLGSIVGLGCFVYFKGSVSFINKFGANIDTGSDKLNKMTLNQIVKSSTKVLGNTDTMSLNDLANEFGYTLSNEIAGFDITELKDAPLSKLGSLIKEKFDKYSDIDNLTIKDVFGDTSKLNNSVLSLIPNYEDVKISNVADELQTAVKNATIDELYNKNLIEIENYNSVKAKIGSKTLTQIVADYILTLDTTENQGE